MFGCRGSVASVMQCNAVMHGDSDVHHSDRHFVIEESVARGPGATHWNGTCLGEMNEEWSQPADGACASSSSGDNCAIVANYNSRL